MKMKALLLGTATAFAVGGAAQAADLAIAVEPVEYVKVCDAFGAGFYYIPGTDTCLRIRGEIEFNAVWADHDFVIVPPSLVANQNWRMETAGKVDFTANTMSDVGLVQAYVKFEGVAPFVGPAIVKLSKAYAVVGPTTWGFMGSVFDTGGGYNFSADGFRGLDTDTNAFLLTYMMGTWGIWVGVEDPFYLSPTTATGDYPDFVAKLTAGTGGFTLGASVKVSDQITGTGWAGTLTGTFDLGGAKLRIGGGYADGLGQALGGAAGSGTTWTALVTGTIPLSGNLALRASANFIDDGVVGDTGYAGAIGPNWQLTSTSEAGVDVFYFQAPGADGRWGLHFRAKSKWAGGT